LVTFVVSVGLDAKSLLSRDDDDDDDAVVEVFAAFVDEVVAALVDESNSLLFVKMTCCSSSMDILESKVEELGDATVAASNMSCTCMVDDLDDLEEGAGGGARVGVSGVSTPHKYFSTSGSAILEEGVEGADDSILVDSKNDSSLVTDDPDATVAAEEDLEDELLLIEEEEEDFLAVFKFLVCVKRSFKVENLKIAIVVAAAVPLTTYKPTPLATPTAAATQIAAAVVKPLTLLCRSYTPLLLRLLVITPAPIKPTPDATLEAMREGSSLAQGEEEVMERKPNMEHIVKAQAPRETRAMVRMPAGWSEVERSSPTSAPPNAAKRRR